MSDDDDDDEDEDDVQDHYASIKCWLNGATMPVTKMMCLKAKTRNTFLKCAVAMTGCFHK